MIIGSIINMEGVLITRWVGPYIGVGLDLRKIRVLYAYFRTYFMVIVYSSQLSFQHSCHEAPKKGLGETLQFRVTCPFLTERVL